MFTNKFLCFKRANQSTHVLLYNLYWLIAIFYSWWLVHIRFPISEVNLFKINFKQINM